MSLISSWIKGGSPGQVIASQTPTEFELGGTYLAADPADGTLMTEAILPIPLKSEVVITDGEWHEVTLAWDGDYRHLYVDDNEVAVDAIVLPAMDMSSVLFWSNDLLLKSLCCSYWTNLLELAAVQNLTDSRRIETHEYAFFTRKHDCPRKVGGY